MSEQGILEAQSVTAYRQQCRRGLTPRHREAMRRLAGGQTISQVAEAMGYSPFHLSKVASSPLFKRELERMMVRLDQANYNALNELRRLHPKAVKTYNDLMTQDEYQTLRFNVAKDLLDRTGVVTARTVHTLEAAQSQSYEQRLSEVKAKYTVSTTHSEDSPIEIMGGEELLKDYDAVNDKKRRVK